MTELITHSVEETQQFAEKFAKEIQPGDIITLSGDLGAGKTTFTQGFAKGLGITQRIISPTFIIARKYRITDSKLSIAYFYHIDLYRLHKEEEIESVGLSEIFGEKDAIAVIEWPERLGSLLPKKRWEIKIESLREDERKITLDKIS